MKLQPTCHHMVISAVKVLVYLGQATLHIPQRDQAQAGSCAGLAMVLQR